MGKISVCRLIARNWQLATSRHNRSHNQLHNQSQNVDRNAQVCIAISSRLVFARKTLCYSAVNSYDSVSVSVCPSVTSRCSVEWLDGSSWSLACRLLSTYLYCILRKSRYLQKIRALPLELCPKLRTSKILLWHIDSRNVVIDSARQRWTLRA